MSNKLKPCPFCGTNAVIQSTLRRHDFDDAIECDDDTCGVFLTACPPRGNLTKGQLIEKWNTRADDKRIAELEADVSAFLAEIAAKISELDSLYGIKDAA